MNKPNLFDNSLIDQHTFLADYWHKKPLVIPQAVPREALKYLPNTEQLKQLSCHDDVQSRVVFKNSETSYDVEYGPFETDDWQNITGECWNLLVSDIDKWRPESTQLLKYFPFIRRWLFDDIMLSCGSINGTVGPHTDQYDVFLLQVSGQRLWHYSEQKKRHIDLIEDQPLKLINGYVPDHSILLKPGDVLYIPPEVAHYGIAQTDDCITCSIGTRTPSHAELLTAYADQVSQKFDEHHRFEEPELLHNLPKGQITPSDMVSIEHIIHRHLLESNQKSNQWFGKFITEYRSLFYEFNQYQQVASFSNKTTLISNPFSKSCYFITEKNAELFVDGLSHFSSIKLAQWICDEKNITPEQFLQLNENDQNIVMALFENGSMLHEKN